VQYWWCRGYSLDASTPAATTKGGYEMDASTPTEHKNRRRVRDDHNNLHRVTAGC
jgi:hypothetical protein